MTRRRRIPTAIVAAVAISAATLGTFASRLGGSLGVHLPSWVEYLLFKIAGLAAGASVGPILHAIRERSRVFSKISDWLTLLDRTTTRLSGASWYFLLVYGFILIYGRENTGGWGYFFLLVSGAFLAFAIGRVGSAQGRGLPASTSGTSPTPSRWSTSPGPSNGASPWRTTIIGWAAWRCATNCS